MIFHENRLPADDSHEISCLICYFWKSSKIWNCCLLQIIGGTLWVKSSSTCTTIRHWWWFRQGKWTMPLHKEKSKGMPCKAKSNGRGESPVAASVETLEDPKWNCWLYLNLIHVAEFWNAPLSPDLINSVLVPEGPVLLFWLGDTSFFIKCFTSEQHKINIENL